MGRYGARAGIGLLRILNPTGGRENQPIMQGVMDKLINDLRDLVIANRILAFEGVVDAFGHISIRHPDPSPSCAEAAFRIGAAGGRINIRLDD